MGTAITKHKVEGHFGKFRCKPNFHFATFTNTKNMEFFQFKLCCISCSRAYTHYP